jgi:hypothetical protein
MSDEWGDEEPEAFSPAILSSPISTQKSSPESEESFVALDEILPESICPVCLNLGNEVWDHAYRRRHGLDAPERRRRWQHRMPIGDVYVAANQSCSGCKVIAWVLEPYMKRLQDEGGEVEVRFEDTWESYAGRLNYYGREVSPPDLRPRAIRLVVKSVHLRSSQGAPPLSNDRFDFEQFQSRCYRIANKNRPFMSMALGKASVYDHLLHRFFGCS